MLNSPLSLLSYDLLAYIVGHVAILPFGLTNLCNLSLADRAFTQFCQAYIFRTLALGGSSGTKKKISKMLINTREMLNVKPSIAHRVRVVDLHISQRRNAWLFNDSTFISILQTLAKSPMPPYKLRLDAPLMIEDPVLVVGRLMQSFFSQTLTILHLTGCKNVPLPLFLVCSRLKEVLLDRVRGTEQSYDNYPEKQITDRACPTLELLDYRDSQSLVEQMINPPPRFVSLSKLRVLTLSPHEKEEMVCLQPILAASCNTLEELHLTSLKVGICEQFSLAELMNLRDLSCLRVFALYAIIKCGVQGSWVLRDINTVLHTISVSNVVTNLSFDFTIIGEHPFNRCLDQDWVGLCGEVIRISASKPLELDLKTKISTGKLDWQHPGQEELYAQIIQRMESLSDYPGICTHYWNPTCWTLGLGPFPRGQVRSRCRR